jgi:hypothetical protein
MNTDRTRHKMSRFIQRDLLRGGAGGRMVAAADRVAKWDSLWSGIGGPCWGQFATLAGTSGGTFSGGVAEAREGESGQSDFVALRCSHPHPACNAMQRNATMQRKQPGPVRPRMLSARTFRSGELESMSKGWSCPGLRHRRSEGATVTRGVEPNPEMVSAPCRHGGRVAKSPVRRRKLLFCNHFRASASWSPGPASVANLLATLPNRGLPPLKSAARIFSRVLEVPGVGRL